MDLSARNQLRGTITALQIEGVMAEVRLQIGDQELVSVITRRSAERLGLRVGDDVLRRHQVHRGHDRQGLGPRVSLS